MCGGWGGCVPGIGGPGGAMNGGRSGTCLGGDPVTKSRSLLKDFTILLLEECAIEGVHY